jgi:hypothetical protein
MRVLMSVVGVLSLLLPLAHAEVLCVRAKKNGTLSGPLKVRTACKKREVQVDGARLGLCCGATVTTTTVAGGTTLTTTVTSLTTLTTAVTIVTTTSLTCPSFTTTSLGVNICGGSPPNCSGLCANARACVNDGIACSCTGSTLPCGVVSNAGACGGTCPGSMVCAQTEVIGSDGCPESLSCGCVAP